MPLEGRDAEDRAQEYHERMRSTPLSSAVSSSIFGTPDASSSNPDTHSLLGGNPITAHDLNFVRALGDAREVQRVISHKAMNAINAFCI